MERLLEGELPFEFCCGEKANKCSCLTLIDCVSNFMNWSGASIPQALKAVTTTPAAMLGLSGIKGSLESDADADLVIINEEIGETGEKALKIDQVWKFGSKVFDRSEER